MNRRRIMDRMPITTTMRYADTRSREPRAQLARLPCWRWWLSPICWAFGHCWPKEGPVLLSEQLCYCRRCREEFDARTR